MAKHQHDKHDTTERPAKIPAILHSLDLSDDDKEWIASEVSDGGPKHKQLYSGLLLERIQELVHTIEKQTKTSFALQDGVTLTSEKEEVEVPIPVPQQSVGKQQAKKVAEQLSAAPVHEIVAFNALLQGIEWSISALTHTRQPAK